jgi:hypothetical protein
MRLWLIPILWSFFITMPNTIVAQAYMPEPLSLKAQAELRDHWLELRLDRLVPSLMQEHKIDVWLIIASEYNEDPVIRTLLPATWMAARRTTILVFARNKQTQTVDRLAIARYDVGRFFKSAWNPDIEPDQFKRLAELIQSYAPERIGINTSYDFSHANGLTHTEFQQLSQALNPTYRTRLVSAEGLAVNWLETRIQEELDAYPYINRIAHRIIDEGLSEKVILPWVTKTSDLQWWYRERIHALGLTAWFHPSVDVQREDRTNQTLRSFAGPTDESIILPGDLIHIDFGITYLGLNTDTQRNAYVLKAGETEAPEGLREALRQGNRLQDILTQNFKLGRSGNEVLRMSLEQAKKEGLQPSIYTHPIGYHGHAAGPTIGMWDKQNGVPGDGDYKLRANTAYAIELNVTVKIPEWNNKAIRMKLEENALFDGEKVVYTDGRKTELILIPRRP